MGGLCRKVTHLSNCPPLTWMYLSKTTNQPQLTIVPPDPHHLIRFIMRIGNTFANAYLRKPSYVRDTHILTERYSRTLLSTKAPWFKPSLSKLTNGLISYRNYQPYGVFCSLNLGVSGIVKDQASLQYLQNNHKIGDIISLMVSEDFQSEVDTGVRKSLINLCVPNQQLVSQFHCNLVNCLGGTEQARYG